MYDDSEGEFPFRPNSEQSAQFFRAHTPECEIKTKAKTGQNKALDEADPKTAPSAAAESPQSSPHVMFKTPKVDHYAILEFEHGTVVEEVDATAVKKAYRKVALKFHPDKGHAAGSLLFKRIQGAYETLSDDFQKREYDNWYSSYYKRRIVTAKAIEKEYKLREKLTAEFIYEQDEPERKKREEEQKAEREAQRKAREAEEQRRRLQAEKERQRNEQRERDRQEKLKQEAQRKERERLRKIQAAERREQEVMEKRREEERLRAEERRKQAELNELQEKIRRATEQVRRQAREAYDDSTYFGHNEEDSSSTTRAPPGRKIHSKDKIMSERAKLKERRKRQHGSSTSATSSSATTDENNFGSREEYIEKVTELKKEYQKSVKQRDEIDVEVIELVAKTERIRVSATKAYEQAKKKYEEKMKLVDIKLNDVKLKKTTSKYLNNKLGDIQFEFHSLVDKYQDVHGNPDFVLKDLEDDKSKPTSKSSTPQKSRSSRPHHSKTPRSETKPNSSTSPEASDPLTPSSKEFQFKASVFAFDDIKSNLPKTQPFMFSFSPAFASESSESIPKPKKETQETKNEAKPGVDFFGSSNPTLDFGTSSSSAPSFGPSTATGDSDKEQIPNLFSGIKSAFPLKSDIPPKTTEKPPFTRSFSSQFSVDQTSKTTPTPASKPGPFSSDGIPQNATSSKPVPTAGSGSSPFASAPKSNSSPSVNMFGNPLPVNTAPPPSSPFGAASSSFSTPTPPASTFTSGSAFSGGGGSGGFRF